LIRPSRLSSRTDRGLKTAPTPARAARLTRTQIQAALKRAGRQRGIEPEADRLREVFRAEWAHQPPLIEDALGKQMLAFLFQLDAACTAADQLAEAVEEAFPQHPDAEILLSFPGSASSSPPASWPRSATTAPASPMPADSRPTPAPHLSPAPPATTGAAASKATGTPPPSATSSTA
jgi:hypothetical protein